MIRNALVLSAALALAGMPAWAGTGSPDRVAHAGSTKFFDNFPFNEDSGLNVCGSSACGHSGETYRPALQFVSAASGTATKISVPINAHSGHRHSDVRIIIRADKDGLPGKAIAEENVTAPPCCVTTTVKMMVNLTAKKPYWLEVAPTTRHDHASWQASDSTDTCTVDENYYGTGWSTIATTSCPAGKIVGK